MLITPSLSEGGEGGAAGGTIFLQALSSNQFATVAKRFLLSLRFSGEKQGGGCLKGQSFEV
jgi:hypothetical protein